jgi:hypothetical protein
MPAESPKNPVITHHLVKVALVESEWPGMQELAIDAVGWHLPGIVLTAENVEELAALFAHAVERNRVRRTPDGHV